MADVIGKYFLGKYPEGGLEIPRKKKDGSNDLPSLVGWGGIRINQRK